MPTQNLLYKKSFPINQYIQISIPSVGEILDDEDNYYNMISMLTAMPIDMMVELDEIGIDFTEIGEWELFLLVFESLKNDDTSLIFGDLDLSKFQTMINDQNGEIILQNHDKVRIDREIARKITNGLREIHGLKKNNKKPGNEEAKKYLLERAKIKKRRAKNRTSYSHLEELIVAMVNTEQFHYGFEGTRELSIYQFNKSVRQVIQKVDYEHRMHGVYAGTISAKDLSQKDFNWLTQQ